MGMLCTSLSADQQSQEQELLTAFCAAKIQFMMAIYCVDASPDTLRTSIRAFISGSVSSFDSRLMSACFASVHMIKSPSE